VLQPHNKNMKKVSLHSFLLFYGKIKVIFLDFNNTHSHSLPIMPTRTQGSKKGPPQLSVPDQLLDGAPAVFLGLPACAYPPVSRRSAVWETESLSLLMTWPIHRHHLCMMMVPMLSCSHCISRSLLEMVLQIQIITSCQIK